MVSQQIGSIAEVSPDLELTILMPCLNEEETLATCIRKAKSFLERAHISGEVLIADNGSVDRSVQIAREEGARVVAVSEKGYGAALRGGIVEARGEFVIIGDADDSYDFENLEPFVEQLRNGYDLVMGNRFRGGIKPGAMPLHHKYLGNPVLSLIGRLFYNIECRDFHCGLRGFLRDAILDLDLKTTGMEFASEMVVRSALSNLKITEVPTTLSPDGRSRAPHLRSWRDGWRHLRFLLMYSPRWLFLYPSILLLGIGLAATLLLLSGPVMFGGRGFDMHTLLVACIAILVGVQALTFGLVARRYAATEGFVPADEKLAGYLNLISLERLIGVGLVAILCGIAGGVWSVLMWRDLGFGPIENSNVMRVLAPSLTAVASGVQIVFTGFLSSLMNIKRR